MGITSESRMRIVIQAQNQATGELQKLTYELRNVQKATGEADGKQKGFMQTLGSMKGQILAAGAALVGFAATVKKVWDFSEEGAQLTRLQTASSSLATSMGGDMNKIVTALKVASNGTVSDMGLMSSASRAMMLGLGADADKLANLMQVAMFRGRAMGLSSEQAFSDIVTGVGRMSPLILDNLGIVVDAEATYAKYAATVGKTADSLTSMEKRQALLNRVLDEGNKMMEAAGGLANDAATPFERLGSTFDNVGNRMKQSLGQAFGGVAGWLADTVSAIDTVAIKMEKLKGVVGDSASSYDEYYTRLENGAAQAGLMVDAQGRLVQAYRTASGRVITNVIDANYMLSRSYWEATKAAEKYKTASERYDKMNGPAPIHAGAAWTIDKSSLDKMGKVSFSQAAVAFSAQEAQRKMSDLTLYMNGPVKAANDAYVNKTRQLLQVLKETGDKLEQLKKTPWKTKEIEETQQKYEDTKGEIKQVADEHSLASKKILFDLAQQRMAQDGLTSAEADALTAMAEKFGLIDKQTASMWADVKQPVDAMSEGKITAQDWLGIMERLATSWTLKVYYETYGVTPWAQPKPKVASDKAKSGGVKVDNPGAATGGSFVVPGYSGLDSVPVTVNATPGEVVDVSPPGSNRRGAGMTLKNYGTIIVANPEDLGNYSRYNRRAV